MSQEGGEKLEEPRDRPEMDPEALAPASETRKQAILGFIEARLKDKQYRGEGPVKIKILSLWIPETRMGIALWRFKEKVEPGKLIAVVSISEKGGGPQGAQIKWTNYNIKKYPDWLEIEKFVHYEEADKKWGNTPQEQARILAEELREMEEAQDLEKELGLTLVSEKEAKELLKLLERAEPMGNR